MITSPILDALDAVARTLETEVRCLLICIVQQMRGDDYLKKTP